MPGSTYSKERSFHLLEGIMNLFESFKGQNGRNHSIFQKTVFYKQILDFHCPSKILCQTSKLWNFVKITAPIHGGDPIAEVQVMDVSLSALISWFMKSIIEFLNNYNLHAIIYTSLILIYIKSKKFILLYYKKCITMLFLIGKSFSSLAIIQLHALSLLQKTLQIRDKFFLYMDPSLCHFILRTVYCGLKTLK